MYWSAFSTCLSMLSLLVLGAMVAQRTPAWRNMLKGDVPAARVATFLMLVTSILYIFTASLVLGGVGATFSPTACKAAGWSCFALYGLVKVWIAWFLIERVHIVLGNGQSRRSSKLYLVNTSIIGCWMVAVLIFLVHIEFHIRPSDDSCVMRAKQYGVLSVMSVDIFTEIYLSVLFVMPLLRGNWLDPALKSVALKSLCAAIIAMTSSTANLALLALFGWHEIMALCVITCCLDTMINVSGIFAVTFGDGNRSSTSTTAAPSNFRFKNQQTFSITTTGIDVEASPETLSRLVHLPKVGLTTTGEEVVAQENSGPPFVHLDVWVPEEKLEEDSGMQSWV